jgi:hypothetical protein
MSDLEHELTLEEVDRLLNDPTIPMQADKIWALLAEVAGQASLPPPNQGDVNSG